MSKLPLIIFLLVLPVRALLAQSSFPDLVGAAFGTRQDLVNGIQFANQYSTVDGHPYFLDGQFHSGSILMTHEVYENQRIRYNLYTQRLEVEYITSSGNLNQFISVPELIPSFTLGSRTFVRMWPGDEPAAYFQVISSGTTAFYIGWTKIKKLSRSDSSREYTFSPPLRKYWMRRGQKLSSFHNKKSFMALFPEAVQKDVSRMLKQRKFSFRQATLTEVEQMIEAALLIHERQRYP